MDCINEMNNLVQNLKVFENEEFGEIRVLGIKNEPWFVGKDIVKALGYDLTTGTSYTHYIKKYCSEEDVKNYNKETQVQYTLEFDYKKLGQRGGLLINEYALYDLTLTSPLPSAKEFKYWVTHKVLPSIRKHGAYMTDNVLEQAISDPDFLIGLLQNLKEEKEKRKLAEETIEKMKPAVVVKETLETSKDSILVGELSKILRQKGIDTGQNRLFEWMRNNGYLIKRKGSDYNMPTQKSMDLGLFEIKETNIVHSTGDVRTKKTTKVTGKGQVYFINKFIKPKEVI